MASWNRNVSMRALRAFSAAAKRESFRLAADELFITSSAVSHQIKQLETALGVQLFLRQPRTLQLTDAGKALANDLDPVLEQLDLIVDRHAGSAGRKILRLSVQPFFASELLIPRLSEFFAENEDITVSVDTVDSSVGQLDKSADASIRLLRKDSSDDGKDLLFSLQLIPMGSPALYDSVRVVGGRITSNFPLIVHDARPKAWQQWQRSSGISLPRQPKTTRLNSMIAVARAAERSVGAALMPLKLCANWLETGLLVPLFDHELQSDEAYFFVHNESSGDDDSINRLRSWVLHNFAAAT